MHMLKVKLSAAHGMLVYDAREPGDWVNPETHGETLYPDQTKRNYALLDVHQKVAPHEALRVSQSRLETAVETHKSTKGRPPRKDAVGLAQWCVTLPREVPREDAEEFFRFTLHLFQQRYGADNVPAGFVHMDETTPHMHFAFIPVVPDRRRGGFKVSAKEAITRKDLQVFHQELSRYINREFRLIGLSGLEINVLNGATKEGNRSIAELKRESAVERLQKTTEEATRIISMAKEQAMRIEMACKGIEAEYLAKKAYVDACDTLSEISMAIPDYAVVKKRLFGSKETVTVPK